MVLQSSDWLLAQTPAVDGIYILYIALRVLHVLSAIVLAGGLFYSRIVLVPAGIDLFAGKRQVWARWVGAATLFLLVSGLMNFMNIMGLAKEQGTPLLSSYHMLFGIKFLLGLFVMFVAAVLAGRTALAEKFRQSASHWLSFALVATVAIVVIGAILRTYHR